MLSDTRNADAQRQTIFGRKRELDNVHASVHADKRRAHRQLFNFVCQGSAADLVKRAMIDVHAALQQLEEHVARLVLQVHDELLFEVRQDAVERVLPLLVEQLLNSRSTGFGLTVPLAIQIAIGESWGTLNRLALVGPVEQHQLVPAALLEAVLSSLHRPANSSLPRLPVMALSAGADALAATAMP